MKFLNIKRLHPGVFKYRVAAYIFILTIAPTQLMEYDVTTFLNTWLSLIITFSLIPLIAKIVCPINPNKRYAQSIAIFLKRFSSQLQRLFVQSRQQVAHTELNYNYFHETVYWEDLLHYGKEDNYNKAIFQDLTDSLLRLNSIISALNNLFFKLSSQQLKAHRHIIKLINEIVTIFDADASQFTRVQHPSKGKPQGKTVDALKTMVATLQKTQYPASVQHATTNTSTAHTSIVSRFTLLVEEIIEFRSIMEKVDLRRLQEARF